MISRVNINKDVLNEEDTVLKKNNYTDPSEPPLNFTVTKEADIMMKVVLTSRKSAMDGESGESDRDPFSNLKSTELMHLRVLALNKAQAQDKTNQQQQQQQKKEVVDPDYIKLELTSEEDIFWHYCWE